MCEISEKEIREYVATGEPMDKAGAYAIQGIASRWIPRIEGDYSNVVGLPVALVYAMLRKA
jgi:septum formation protein